MRSIPTDTASLLDELEKQYPARCRNLGEPELEHERYAGKVALIAEVRARLEKNPSTTY